MSRYVKGLVQSELERRFEGISDFVVVNTIGVDGVTNNQIRGRLGAKGIKMTVVKNSLMLKALKNLGVENAADVFQGSCTIAVGGDSVVDIAKEIVDIGKKVKVFTVKGAYVDGQCLDADAAKALSKMPNRAELQATVVRIAQTPGINVAGAIAGPAGVIAGCIKTIIEKAEKDAA